MKKNFLLPVFLFLATFFSLPAAAGLVKCVISEGNALCSFCSLLATIQATVNFIIGLAFLFGVILIAVNGLKMYWTQGNASKVQEALKNILNVVTGIVIVLCAWVIINTIIHFLARPGSPPAFWNQISC